MILHIWTNGKYLVENDHEVLKTRLLREKESGDCGKRSCSLQTTDRVETGLHWSATLLEHQDLREDSK
jgi:hypothetical protein